MKIHLIPIINNNIDYVKPEAIISLEYFENILGQEICYATYRINDCGVEKLDTGRIEEKYVKKYFSFNKLNYHEEIRKMQEETKKALEMRYNEKIHKN
jgi:hypothetical protein